MVDVMVGVCERTAKGLVVWGRAECGACGERDREREPGFAVGFTLVNEGGDGWTGRV